MASVHKTQAGTYQVRWRDNTRTMRAKNFRRHVDARTYAREVEHQMSRGTYIDPKSGEVLFGDWAEEVMAGRVNLRPSTVARDRSILTSLILPTFGTRRLDSITPTDVQSWVADLHGQGKAPTTTRKAYQILSLTFRAAVNADLLPRSPAREVRLPKNEPTEMRFLTVDQVQELSKAIEPRYSALVLTAAFTGLRFGELAGLRPQHLDLENGALTVSDNLTEVRGQVVIGPPKTNAARRTVALPAFLVKILRIHLSAYSGDFVFGSPEGGPLRRGNFRKRYWLPAVRDSVGGHLRFHDLRHSHVAMLIEQGAHPKVITQRLGHTSARVILDVYGHLLGGLDRKVADDLDALGRRSVHYLFTPDGANVIDLPPR